MKTMINQFAGNTDELLEEMVSRQFFLPAEVRVLLAAQGWEIQPIKVLEQEEFQAAIPLLLQYGTLVYIESEMLVCAAKKVAVAIRSRESVDPLHSSQYGTKFVALVKVWLEQ